jgi:hypothetical protein
MASRIGDQSQQTKLQGLQDPNEINYDKLNNVIREASRNFWGKRGII